MSSMSASPAGCSVTCSSDSLSVSFYRCPQTWTHSPAFKMTVASSFLHWNSNNRSTVIHLHWYLKVQMSSWEPHMHHCDSVHGPYAQPRAADTAVGRNVTLESELPWSREARNTHTHNSIRQPNQYTHLSKCQFVDLLLRRLLAGLHSPFSQTFMSWKCHNEWHSVFHPVTLWAIFSNFSNFQCHLCCSILNMPTYLTLDHFFYCVIFLFFFFCVQHIF